MPTTIDVSGSGAETRSASATSAVYNPPSNDNVASATMITYHLADIGGSPVTVAFSTIASSRESGENILGGTAPSGGLSQGTIWYRIVNASVPAGNIVRFVSNDPVFMEVFALPAGGPATTADFPSMALRGTSSEPGVVYDSTQSAIIPNHGYTITPVTGGPVLAWTIKAGEQYYVRVHSLGYYSEPLDGHLTYDLEAPVLQLRLTSSVLTSTPNVLIASITGGTPNAIITFEIDGTPQLGDRQLDSDGDLIGSPIQVPFMASGSHILLMTDSTSGYTSGTLGTFTVSDQFAYYDDPLPPTFMLPGTPVPDSDGVLRFQLNDPTTNTSFSFPINPAQVSTMASQRTITSGTTTSPVGTPILWEGGKRGRAVTLTGDVLTLAQLNDLRSWCAKPYRVFMSDEIGRQWVVMFRSIKATPVHDNRNPEHHTYILTLLLLGRVQDLDIPDPDYPELHLYPAENLYPVNL
jgi:hypothetical protein